MKTITTPKAMPMSRKPVLHGEDRVHRRIRLASDLAEDVGHRLEVFVVAEPFPLALSGRDELRQGNHATVPGVHVELQKLVEVRALSAVEKEDDGYGIAAGRHVGETGLGAGQGDPQGTHDLLRSDPGQHGLLAIYLHLP
ncbi:MAG: hypothetical protein P8Y93_07195, partial [Acidobacteriota bacterium]